MRWLGGVLDTDGEAATRTRVEGCAARNGFCFWPVERKIDGEILGFCGLKLADAPGSSVTGEMEVGWRLREDAWGQGYAKEAATAALDVAFDRFGGDEVARPHDRATLDRLAMECEEVAELLVQVAVEDGHAGMLASALHALVLRIAGGGIEAAGEDA